MEDNVFIDERGRISDLQPELRTGGRGQKFEVERDGVVAGGYVEVPGPRPERGPGEVSGRVIVAGTGGGGVGVGGGSVMKRQAAPCHRRFAPRQPCRRSGPPSRVEVGSVLRRVQAESGKVRVVVIEESVRRVGPVV